MTAVNPFAPRADHGPGCQCLRCLASGYGSATAKVNACTTRYHAIRRTSTSPEAVARARTQWTEARRELVLAEHALRTAEDDARFEKLRNAEIDALRWNPRESQ